MGKGIELKTRKDGDGLWRVIKNRKPSRYLIREKEDGFHIECTDAMHPKTQAELFPLSFPHQAAALQHVWDKYVSKGY